MPDVDAPDPLKRKGIVVELDLAADRGHLADEGLAQRLEYAELTSTGARIDVTLEGESRRATMGW